MGTLLRITGWTSIAAGLLILLYLVYALVFTNYATTAAQAELLERWTVEVGDVRPDAGEDGDVRPDAGEDADEDPVTARPAAVHPGDGLAVLQFRRPGTEEPLVHDAPLFVTEGVGTEELKRGPGHYPGTALPGADGNFAVAGHRTTYGAPFFHLDRLVRGDEIHVTDRDNRRHVYEVVETRVVAPSDSSVLGADPLGRGRPLLTLTTCEPRFSRKQRLIVFAELRP